MNPANILAALVQLDGWRQSITMAWRPLLDPLPVDTYWLWLALPLVLAIAVVYKALKLEDLAKLPAQALFLAAQFVVLMAVAAVILWLITELV